MRRAGTLLPSGTMYFHRYALRFLAALCTSLVLAGLPVLATKAGVSEPIALDPVAGRPAAVNRGKILVAQSEGSVAQPEGEKSKTAAASIKGTVINFT